MAIVVLTKKQKHQMKIRRKKKKLAQLLEKGEISEAELKVQLEKLQQQMHSPIDDEKTETDTKENEIKRNIEFTSNIVIVPSHLSSKEAKKFRKDERRKARARGLDDSKLQFRNENEEPPKKKRKFPSINELVQQQKVEQEQERKEKARKEVNENLSEEEKAKYVALDCEMVGTGSSGKRSVLARASMTDWNGNVLMDTFVTVPERVTDFRTHVSGVTAKLIRSKNKAIDPSECREKVASILKGKVLVGHALKNDLHALMLTHPKEDIRDTAKYRPFQRLGGKKWRPRKLRDLVQENVGISIQQAGESHDSVDDARATMELFKIVREEWEKELNESKGKRKR